MRGPAVRACAPIPHAYSRRGAGRAAAPGALPWIAHAIRRALCVPLLGIAVTTCARAEDASVEHLLGLSLEELSNVVVTSVSRRPEPLSEAAASVYVISAEDIRRSGATSLPEALRLAPNLEIARADNNQYAISARGFNNVLANKMLVLIDGRIVYSPLFSGVFWEAQDVMLEDVERIEVISGPGATLWGANAVNGVINVITRPASATQGALATAGVGNRERGSAVRYGGRLANGGYYRVYGKYFDRSHTAFANGTPIRDASERSQAGFRADWGHYTVQGDAYHDDIDQSPAARKVSGANLLARWSRTAADGTTTRVQAYIDHNERNHPGQFHENINVFDVEAQTGLKPTRRQEIVWGGGYRYAIDDVENSAVLAFLPPDERLHWANLFVQDEIALLERLHLTLGSKVETNSYTGAEYLPSARLAWQADASRLVWGAVSRAVRAPSRVDREFFQPGNPPYILAGGPTFVSEVSDVYELGYRAQPTAAVSYSITAFEHRHQRLRSIEPTSSGLMFENRIAGHTTGVEAWGSYRVTNDWRLTGGFVRMNQSLHKEAGSADLGGLAALGNDPTYWWQLRSSFDLTARHELDIAVRRTGALPNPQVPAYTAVDARFGWRVRRDLEVSLVGQNLLDPGHTESGTPANRAEFGRAVFLKLLWRS